MKRLLIFLVCCLSVAVTVDVYAFRAMQSSGSVVYCAVCGQRTTVGALKSHMQKNTHRNLLYNLYKNSSILVFYPS